MLTDSDSDMMLDHTGEEIAVAVTAQLRQAARSALSHTGPTVVFLRSPARPGLDPTFRSVRILAKVDPVLHRIRPQFADKDSVLGALDWIAASAGLKYGARERSA